MSRLSGAAGAAAARLRAGWRPLLAVALVGGLAGLGWGLAAEPEYAATATVVVVDRGSTIETAGPGAVGGTGPAATERLLELARSEDVAELAAASLGGDVSGADLLSLTEFRGGDRGGTLVVRSAAGFPDFAVAAANAFAGAVVELATLNERRRLRSAEQRATERLATLDPASEQAIDLQARIDAIAALGELGPPLRDGRGAELPPAAEPGRSVARAALAGASLGLLIVAAGLLGAEAYRRPVRRVEQLREAVGVPFAGSVGDRAAALELRAGADGVVSSERLGDDRMQALAAALGLDSADGRRRTVAVVSPMPGEGRTTIAAGLAAAAARRGRRVLLIEADLRRPCLGERFRIDQAPGLSDYLAGSAAPREVIRTVTLAGEAPPRHPLSVCPPARSVRPRSRFSPALASPPCSSSCAASMTWSCSTRPRC